MQVTGPIFLAPENNFVLEPDNLRGSSLEPVSPPVESNSCLKRTQVRKQIHIAGDAVSHLLSFWL